LQAKNPYPQLKLHRLATANDRLRVAEPRADQAAHRGANADSVPMRAATKMA
jgi:hypothetical protein